MSNTVLSWLETQLIDQVGTRLVRESDGDEGQSQTDVSQFINTVAMGHSDSEQLYSDQRVS